jgi:hypothetical protein
MPDRYVPSAEMVQTLLNIQTEIGAGICMRPRDDAETGYNIGCHRALRIIDNYINGIGLFQIVADPLMNRGPHA